MKKLLLRIHRIIALSAGVLIVAVCVSGALLVYRDALAPIASPSLQVGASAEPVAYARILANAQAHATAEERIEIRPHADPARAALVALHGETIRFLYANPRTGAIVGGGAGNEGLFEMLFRFHRYLLTGNRGEYVVAFLASLLTVLAVSGLVMWWPRKWRSAWRIRPDSNRLAFNFDLHKALGPLVAPLLLVNAITGLIMIFSDASTSLVNRLYSATPLVAPVLATNTGPAAGPSLDALVAAANAAFPAGVVTQVMVRSPGQPVVVRKRTPAENNPLGGNRIYLDARSGGLLAVIPLGSQPPGIRMYEWLYPLHTGVLFGNPYRLILAVAGAATLVMMMTGLLVWQSRRRRRD